ncbi:hypothetical protein D3C78_1525240 [compost metagenome]
MQPLDDVGGGGAIQPQLHADGGLVQPRAERQRGQHAVLHGRHVLRLALFVEHGVVDLVQAPHQIAGARPQHLFGRIENIAVCLLSCDALLGRRLFLYIRHVEAAPIS